MGDYTLLTWVASIRGMFISGSEFRIMQQLEGAEPSAGICLTFL